MKDFLSPCILVMGFAQMCVLIASALVPLRLGWRNQLRDLPQLHRQLFWVYGGYIVLSIVSLSWLCILNADELAAGSGLACSVCLYGAAFWGIRLSLQAFLDVRQYLTAWWLKAGYHLLTVLFASFTAVYLWGAAQSQSLAASGGGSGSVGSPKSMNFMP
jgi:hypothetical protein